MNEKRYYKFLDDKQEWVIRDRTNRRQEYRVGRNKRYAEKLVDLLNSLVEENEQLRKQITKYDCEDCINYKSYCFDEYDSDCYCSVFDELKYEGCEKYEKRSNDE